jgi:DNA primase
MARIPEDELERLKRETDLAALVRASGVELAKKGRDLVGLCPFHDDTDPSLVISRGPDGHRLWNCLGACGAGGTAIDWVRAVPEGAKRGGVPRASAYNERCYTQRA